VFYCFACVKSIIIIEQMKKTIKAVYYTVIKLFIKSILKSMVILAMWLALSSVIYSRIALSFALNRIFFSANENGTVKQNNQSDFKAFFKLNNHIAGKWQKTKTKNKKNKQTTHCFANLAIKLCSFKMDLIKWQLNFRSCNFGLKSYLWIQIELVLHARWILKSHVWFRTKLHSTQFNYHYVLHCDKTLWTFDNTREM